MVLLFLVLISTRHGSALSIKWMNMPSCTVAFCSIVGFHPPLPSPAPRTRRVSTLRLSKVAPRSKKTNFFFWLESDISTGGKHSSPCKYSVSSPQHTRTHVSLALMHVVAMAINPTKTLYLTALFLGTHTPNSLTNAPYTSSDPGTLVSFVAANFDWNESVWGGGLLRALSPKIVWK